MIFKKQIQKICDDLGFKLVYYPDKIAYYVEWNDSRFYSGKATIAKIITEDPIRNIDLVTTIHITRDFWQPYKTMTDDKRFKYIWEEVGDYYELDLTAPLLTRFFFKRLKKKIDKIDLIEKQEKIESKMRELEKDF